MYTGCVRTGDIEMAYFCFGTGSRDLVILPGVDVKSVLLSRKAVERAYRSFADTFRVWVFDRRQNLPDDYSIRAMARDTAIDMRAVGITRADIFGASQGGMIAQYIAIDDPALVRSMVLGSTAPTVTPTLQETVSRWRELAECGDIRGLTGDFIDRLYSERTIGKYRDVLLHMNDHVTADDLRRFVILLRGMEGFDTTEELPRVQCPVLVIGVEGDRALGSLGSRQLSDLLGCDCYLYSDEYGHCVFDEAEDYRDRMLSFFCSVEVDN